MANQIDEVEGYYRICRVVARAVVRREDQMGDTTRDIVLTENEKKVARDSLPATIKAVLNGRPN